MEIFAKFSLKRILVFTTVLCIGSFFALLLYANAVNRKGITELNDLNKEIADYEVKLRETEMVIATYSSLGRVEQRAKELGFEETKNIEYLK